MRRILYQRKITGTSTIDQSTAQAAPREADPRMTRLYRLHAVQIPLMRVSAYTLLTLLVALYTSALDGRVDVRAVTQFGLLGAMYSAATWLALHLHYSRPLEDHQARLAYAITLLDPFVIAAAIYLTGADASWLFPLILLPIVSQSYLNGRRAVVVAFSAAAAYAAMLLYAQRLGTPIVWPVATVKIAMIGGVAFYCIGLGVIEERYRSRMIRALRDAKRDSEMRVAELASLNRVTRTAAGTLDVQQMLDEITSEVVALFNAAGGEIVLGSCEEVADERTIVAPLRSYGDTIGAMVVRAGRRLRGPFTPEDRELAETIAGQIAGPVTNARLYVEEKRSRELAERLHKIAGAMAESLDQQKVLDEILRQLAQIIEFDSGTVQLIEGDAMRVLAAWNLPESEVGRLRPLKTHPYNARLAQSSSPVLLSVAAARDLWHGSEEMPEVKSVLGVPLIVRDQTIGALSIESTRRRAYTDADARAMQSFAQHAAIALDHARLYGVVQEASLRDALTGVANRRKFEEVLHAEWQRASRERTPVAALMIDVDAFKAYNDRYGHQRGDEVLRRVADQLRSRANGHLVARYGGEEFVVMACAPLDAAARLAESMRASIEGLSLPHEGSPSGLVTISVGVASAVPSPEETQAALLAVADARLYEAKRSGRNRVVA
ncbi:MAG TPA: diguanylate cyclase [Thermoanaerobaculia bacterium]